MVRIAVAAALDCSADAAWRAAHSPAAAGQLYRPLLQMRPRGGAQFPAVFETGSRVDVALRFFGVLPAGTQRIVIVDLDAQEANSRAAGSQTVGSQARTMRDAGCPLSGPLALISSWNHEITIIPAGPRSAVWRDELTIGGWFAPLAAVVLWPMWRWRVQKLRKLARGWRAQ
ncbi:MULTISPECIES: hypothetical protein [unclassified Leucobacter]|uniref:hypothetical protein n=1 Tax=unclassified Leucobacter TaxID=2621730 RepID=UPI00301779FC